MKYAPIAIIACRRPAHLQNLLDSLKKNPEAIHSAVYIFVGGPKNKEDWKSVRDTIKVAEACTGFKSLAVEKKMDLLSGSELIHAGVAQIFEKYESIIVLEDDLIVREDFLLYMNLSLTRYNTDDRVSQISAWNYETIPYGSPECTYFFPTTTPWGWGTWRRAWQYTPNLTEEFNWLTNRSRRIHNFNFKENYDCLGMIEAVITDNYDAWDAQWYLHCFRNSKLILYPNSSLIINRGFDGSGLNFTREFQWNKNIFDKPQSQFVFSNSVEVSYEFKYYLKSLKRWVKVAQGGYRILIFFHKILRKIRQHLKYYKIGFYSRG